MKTNGKRILHAITVSSVGGAQSVVVNLANAQCVSNDVWVFSSDSCEAWKALDPRVHIIAVRELDKPVSLKDIIVLSKMLYWRFKLKPDIVHLHSSKIGLFGRLVFPARKTIYTVHGFDSMRVANRRFLFLEKLLKNHCRFIVAVSQYDTDGLRGEGISKNVRLVYNAIDDPSAEPLSEQNASLMQRLAEFKAGYKKLILSIARDDPPKRLDIFTSLAQTFPDYAFVWMGDYHPHVSEGNLLFLGQIPMGYQLLKACDLFLLCSDFEGLPISILEALAFSRPVVSSKVGGVTEIMDERCGFAVDNSVDAFRGAISAVFENDGKYGDFCSNARRTYEGKFTLDRMVDGYDELYYELCAAKR